MSSRRSSALTDPGPATDSPSSCVSKGTWKGQKSLSARDLLGLTFFSPRFSPNSTTGEHMRWFPITLLAVVASLTLIGGATAHELDHPAPAASLNAPLGTGLNSSPAGAWQLVTTFPTGNPHTDLDFFEQDDEIYASVGTLAAGPNGGGQSIVRLTEERRGQRADAEVRHRPSLRGVHEQPARCARAPARRRGDAEGRRHLQHEGAARVTRRGAADPRRERRAGPLPRPGRRRASGAPQGGLEIVDITQMGRLDNDLESVSAPRVRCCRTRFAARSRSRSRATSARRTPSTSTRSARTSPTRSPRMRSG